MNPLRALLAPDKLQAALDALPDTDWGYDQWGFSPEYCRTWAPAAYWLYRYFRPEIRGIEHVPEGRVLIVPNHSGQLPFDAFVVGVACLIEARPPRFVRGMVERWFPRLPYINIAFSRMGAVVGDPINCRNLLEADNAILVFPEGAKGSGKIWKNRYRLEKFGRGFMRLALQTNTPIVPVAVVGAEESIISVHDARSIANRFGMPYMPISPLLPILGPAAYLPLPTKFHVEFGAPMWFDGPFDDEDEVIQAKADQVRARVQEMVNAGLERRKGIF